MKQSLKKHIIERLGFEKPDLSERDLFHKVFDKLVD